MEAAIQVVKCYINRLEFYAEWPGSSLEDFSYAIWSANEILRALEERGDDPPLLVIEGFQERMKRYATFNKTFGFIFDVSVDVAESIVDWLIN
ncbi:hypothetical protein FACS189499_04810 [Clostridia bacterium]|nr:hypothetical protein FACS189499_04810 [Clostridia bacterium]